MPTHMQQNIKQQQFTKRNIHQQHQQHQQQQQQYAKRNIHQQQQLQQLQQQQQIQQGNIGRPLPKFGEWDVNNPASAEGFTMIFNKARDEKKTTKAAVVNIDTPRMSDPVYNNDGYPYPKRKSSKWFCCGRPKRA